MAFEKFEMQRKGAGLTLSFTKRGCIILGNVIKRRFGVGAGSFICLYYDQQKTQIAIEFGVGKDEKGALKAQGGERIVYFYASRFFRYFDINTQETKTYTATIGGKDNIVIVDLKKGILRCKKN